LEMAQRVTVILAGYLAASLAAGLVFSVVLAAKYSDSIGNGAGLLIAGTVLIAIYAAILALLPAFLGIIYAERTGVTSILYYAVGGALAGIVAYGLFALLLISSAGTTKGFGSENPSQFLLSWIVGFGAPGLAGGLVYWLVAGRKAGQGR
jgi:hypothetical protein